jgi:hypothetical protein
MRWRHIWYRLVSYPDCISYKYRVVVSKPSTIHLNSRGWICFSLIHITSVTYHNKRHEHLWKSSVYRFLHFISANSVNNHMSSQITFRLSANWTCIPSLSTVCINMSSKWFLWRIMLSKFHIYNASYHCVQHTCVCSKITLDGKQFHVSITCMASLRTDYSYAVWRMPCKFHIYSLSQTYTQAVFPVKRLLWYLTTVYINHVLS